MSFVPDSLWPPLSSHSLVAVSLQSRPNSVAAPFTTETGGRMSKTQVGHDQDVPEHWSLHKEKLACFALLEVQVNREQTGQEDCAQNDLSLSTVLAN